MPNVTLTFQRPKLYAKQYAAIYEPKRYSVIEASTKAGKTVGCLVWLWEQAWVNGKPGRNFWWIAPVYGQSLIAFRRLARWVPKDICRINRQELTITLIPNGAVISFKSGDNPDNLYGEDVWAAVIDEATRCKEDVFFAIRSTLTATRGPVRIIGNVKGRRNWVYRLGVKGREGDPTIAYHRLTAYDAVQAGVLAAEEIADAKRALPEHVFNELYLAIPSDDGANPFGLAKIAAHVMDPARAMQAAGSRPVVWAWDLARKVDWTVGIALNAEREVCGFHRWQRPWTECIDEIVRLSYGIPTVLDSTGAGDVVLDIVQRRHSSAEGFIFTPRTKQQIMEGLAITLGEGRGPWFPEGPIREELELFEYEHRPSGIFYSAPDGTHDDCVCALAMANEKWRDRGNSASVGGALVSF